MFSPEFFIKAGQLLLSLSILIALHELGHFIPARIFGCRVEKFYLFFDVKYSLFKKKIGETVYGIGWLPLGGYVKISGMIDESFDKEQMQKPPQPWEFRSKPAWQRLIIMLGGVTVNLLLGFFIYMMVLFVWGKETLPQENIPLGLEPSAFIQEIGFDKGDKIIDVDGEELENVLDINRILLLRPVDKVKVEKLDGSISEINIPENIGNDIFQSGQMRSFDPLFSATIDSVYNDSPALYAGMQSGDVIVSVNGQSIYDWGDFSNWIDNNPDDLIDIEVERGNDANVSLFWDESEDKWTVTNTSGTYQILQSVGGTTFKVTLAASSSFVSKASNTYTVTHSLGTKDVIIQVMDVSGGSPTYETVFTENQRPTDDTVTIAFANTVTDGDYRVLISQV